MFKNKRAWLRILEAFMAVTVILGVVLVVINPKANNEEFDKQEITVLQASLLESIAKDDKLKQDIINNNLASVYDYVGRIMPFNYNYSVKRCLYNEICNLDFTLNTEVYADEIPIIATITNYTSDQAYKIKIFSWRK